MCVCSVDVALLKDGEVWPEAAAWTHMLQGIHDLIIGAVLLQSGKYFMLSRITCETVNTATSQIKVSIGSTKRTEIVSILFKLDRSIISRPSRI